MCILNVRGDEKCRVYVCVCVCVYVSGVTFLNLFRVPKHIMIAETKLYDTNILLFPVFITVWDYER